MARFWHVIFLLSIWAVKNVHCDYSEDACLGDSTVLVHMFNWKWTDVAAECERYLAPHGFCGVQISPPNEHRVVTDPDRTWWERYQPVSFLLESRSGNREEFIDMVQRCNNVGVNIYSDAMLNHVLAQSAGQGYGSGGTYYDTHAFNFTGWPYYTEDDFNCCGCDRCPVDGCSGRDVHNPKEMRNCQLYDLMDVRQDRPETQQKIIKYMNDLIDMGVAGFHIDSAEYMWPDDLESIFSHLHDLNTRWFEPNVRPFMYHEIVDMGDQAIKTEEYFHLGRITEFKYCDKLGAAFRGVTSLADLRHFETLWELAPGESTLVYVDNKSNQRGHPPGGDYVLTFFEPRLYIMGSAFKLAHPYGVPRIMSSYWWEGGPHDNADAGPPANPDKTIKDVVINPDGSCGNDWACEHRWKEITNMVKFRNVVNGERLLHWWDNGKQQIAFGRGDKGFLAINAEENEDLLETMQTGLPEGTYCDVISGDLIDGSCSGSSFKVEQSGRAEISIPSDAENPVVALHIGARLQDTN